LLSAQGWAGLFSIQPFYDPATFNTQTIWRATSFAALTYIGFDGVTTLSEDVENPRRNVLLATVLVCLLTGLLSTVIVYLGQRVWPDWRTFSNLETAFMDVCRRAGGAPLSQAMSVVMLIAMLGSGLTGALGAARLLFGMGRDEVLPHRLFARLSPGSGTPTYGILTVGIASCLGALALDMVGNAFEHAGQLLNFGAFLAFMGVNLAAFRHFGLRKHSTGVARFVADAVLPLIGFAFCAAIWWNLNTVATTAGGVWIFCGAAYMLIKTRGLRTELPQFRMEGEIHGQA
jgi:amino acid transporter